MIPKVNWQKIETQADSLEGREYFDAFASLRDAYKHRFRKYEARLEYHDAGNPSFEAYLRGDMDTAIALLREGLTPSAKSYEKIREEGVTFTRVRPYVWPLNSYLAWEFLSYQISIELGENIFLFDANKHPETLFPNQRDFVLFDDFAAIIINYNSSGALLGGHVVESQDDIESLAALFDTLETFATPFDEVVEMGEDVFQLRHVPAED